jgi:hypothetical protein
LNTLRTVSVALIINDFRSLIPSLPTAASMHKRNVRATERASALCARHLWRLAARVTVCFVDRIVGWAFYSDTFYRRSFTARRSRPPIRSTAWDFLLRRGSGRRFAEYLFLIAKKTSKTIESNVFSSSYRVERNQDQKAAAQWIERSA